ncbi:MAG: bifunctional 3,4-dihydroxy-2-butanone-4-phosphate synthase/GTP cyclohydrolase II [Candidatus Nephthysia bennettiae]|uniref:Riboflavin biosynthesis protein RibBA n=1 Tax=Candidatus Nephthysia bennettiae TaxID=3127016 RepID=A0A934KB47_9BACT|nr:bifunctional 3,4-dihydroxy-2-butanone-4-phosphate synthase/GTP cyclohydrolase II [Candidatus Dormibacteraeota bacterium]MBJ7611087.1 bifunctional 3,4-dihydroxy-2-butanone-4-phosphate synthase/GTP cyclohydrolase II [Candidatus Dormibacteraeota bacterium]PZR91252.1 MAG: bifunctional 3,4-dihydroxy-2-butanone-4-phosphate synthase/GTP cyclohydrolase II [Candidatus Dormibacteraeota bacterium]
MPLATIPEAIADYEDGKFVIVVDDEDRENEGDLCVAAQLITPEHIMFMSRHAGGLICTPLVASRLDELQIEPMVMHNTSRYGTAFSVSIEAKDLVTTGISAYDRAATIRHLISPEARTADFAKPGHTFPLRAAEGGVLKRAGQTEAAVDLAALAGLYPAGVICEIMNEDGTMARLPDLERFSATHGFKIITIKDLIAYRRRNEKLVRRRVVTRIPIDGREWQVHAYEDVLTQDVHLALVLGEIDSSRPVLLRAHSCCLTGDVFGSQRCDCGPQLDAAMETIAQEGTGVVLYIGNHEGRGIGLINKLRAYNLQDEGLDTVEANEALDQPADSRDYGIGNQILYDLGVRKMRVLTNNPRKLIGIEGYGMEVVEQVPIRIEANRHNARYLQTKKDKLGHLL